jgi:hypothetical protein
MRLYQQLGLAGTMNVMFESSAPVVKMLGLKADAQYRVAGMDVPNGPKVEFIDFKGVDRRTVRANIQDPGSTRMQLQVRDVDAVIESLKAAGGAVVSTGGTTVALPGRGGATTKVAIVRDPNNLFLVLIQGGRRLSLGSVRLQVDVRPAEAGRYITHRIALLLIRCWLPTAVAADDRPSLQAILARVTDYVVRYESTIQGIVAEEHYPDADKADRPFVTHRELKSDLLLVRADGPTSATCSSAMSSKWMAMPCATAAIV